MVSGSFFVFWAFDALREELDPFFKIFLKLVLLNEVCKRLSLHFIDQIVFLLQGPIAVFSPLYLLLDPFHPRYLLLVFRNFGGWNFISFLKHLLLLPQLDNFPLDHLEPALPIMVRVNGV
jgi:hypothetical protein